MENENVQAEIEAILDKAYEEPDPLVQVDLYNQAIRVADTAGDDEAGFGLRTELFRAVNETGQVDQLVVHFAWCIARTDADPERFPIEDLLWTYKWIVGDLPLFPHVATAKIRAMLADFARRMAERGEGERTSKYFQMKVAADLGQLDEAASLIDGWQRVDRDAWSDCRACERDSLVTVLTLLGRHEEALEAAKPLLQGRMVCAEVPLITYGELVYPALKLGRFEEAAGYWTAGFRKADQRNKFTKTLGQHMQLAALTHNPQLGLGVMEKHLAWALQTPRVGDRLHFLRGVELLMRRLSGKSLRLRLPPKCDAYSDAGEYQADALRDWAVATLTELEAQFDRRNGTDLHARTSREVRELLDAVPPTPIPTAVAGRERRGDDA
jgi:hypothetical protein